MEKDDERRLGQLNPIIQVAMELGLKVRGNLAHCFRMERHTDSETPTLFFQVSENRFRCKICADVYGDVIDFVCQYKGWDRQKATDWLAHRIDFDRQTRKLYYGKGKRR
jgi:hypothetical protein